MKTKKILAICGSTRRDSLNLVVLKRAIELAKKTTLQITLLDLNHYEMPMYNQDLEEIFGLGDNAVALKKLFKEHQGLLIASPEHNGSISSVLKNTIDWVSRQQNPEEIYLECFQGKTAAILSASPGQFGGYKSEKHLHDILYGLGVNVIPGNVSIPYAHEVLADSDLWEKKYEGKICSLLGDLEQLTTDHS